MAIIADHHKVRVDLHFCVNIIFAIQKYLDIGL